MRERKPNGYWTPKTIDADFDGKIKELGRNPTSREARKVRTAIGAGKYGESIRTWNQYLKHRNFQTHTLNEEQIDLFYQTLKSELGRVPTSKEFRKKHPGAFDFITDENYNPLINTWVKYVVSMGDKPHRKIHSIAGEDVDDAFDNLKCELGRVPSRREFASRHNAELHIIRSGKYVPEVTSWQQYLAYRGEIGRERLGSRSDSIAVLEAILDEGGQR